MTENKLFEDPKILRMFLKIALPGALGMLASAIYALIDGIFVNLFLGPTSFSAINFAFPVVIMIYAVSDLIGVGSSVIIAIKLGEGKKEEANGIFNFALLLILGADILVALITFFAAAPLLRAMGAEGEFLRQGALYLKVYAISLPISGYIFAMDNYLRISGRVKTSMLVNISMSVFIVLMEYLLLGVFHLSVEFSAMASCLGFSLFALLCFIPFFFKKNTLRLGKPALEKGLFLSIGKNGLATFLSNIAARLTSVLFNMILLKEGGENAVSVYGVLMYVDGFVVPLLYGMSDSLQPCIGYNYGAKQYERVKKITGLTYIAGILICIPSFFILLFAPDALARLFVSSGGSEVVSMASGALKIFAFLYLTRWFVQSTQGFFQAVGKPLPSILVSFSNAFLLPVALLYAMQGMGLLGVWLNFPISGTIAAVLALGLLLYFLKAKRLLDPSKELALAEKEPSKGV